MQKLTNKIFIKGTIECKTGLRIGGNKSSLEIGGLDLNIIKTANGEPYIPGSSLKGKLRSLLGKVRGKEKAADDPDEIKNLFGDSGGKEAKGITRLFVRDAHLNTEEFKKKFPGWDVKESGYSEIKTENVINRSTGKAEHPRNIERVPSKTVFEFEMVLDGYNNEDMTSYIKLLKDGFDLLELDYLGGHGSRGSGKIEIKITEIVGKSISESGIEKMKDRPWQLLIDHFSPKAPAQ
jgi:CRISPR-associated protein Csm3